MTRTVLSIGSNLGDRMAQVKGAVDGLRLFIPTVSSVYETPPWGDAEQSPYLNAVAIVSRPGVTPYDWLGLAQDLEEAAGRVRDPDRPFGPRTLDVDVIAVWDVNRPILMDDPELTLPHPWAHCRAFVLVPWLEIEPEGILPGCGRVADLVHAEPNSADAENVKLVGRVR